MYVYAIYFVFIIFLEWMIDRRTSVFLRFGCRQPQKKNVA